MRSIGVSELDAVQGGLDLRSVQVRQDGGAAALGASGASFGDVPLLAANDPSLADLPQPAPPAGGQDGIGDLSSFIQQIMGGQNAGEGTGQSQGQQEPQSPDAPTGTHAAPTRHDGPMEDGPMGHGEPTSHGDSPDAYAPMGHDDRSMMMMDQGDPGYGAMGGDQMAMAGPGAYGDDMGPSGYQDYGGESGYC